MKSGPNLSPAVLQQRHEARDSLDDFPTIPWATRAFMAEIFLPMLADPWQKRCWEPACNRGYLARPLDEFFERVYCSDVHDYGWAGMQTQVDFLLPYSGYDVLGGDDNPDWIISNPPYVLGQEFILRALSIAKTGVAMLVRGSFTEGQTRYAELYARYPMAVKVDYAERLNLVKGCVDPDANRPTAYSWVVWKKGETDTRHRIIRPCRAEYERASDYPAKAIIQDDAGPLFGGDHG